MTALTWGQARNKMECDCLDKSATICALLNEYDPPPCECPCHKYISDVETPKTPKGARRA